MKNLMSNTQANHKILIIGAGSIGRRHAANLSRIGCRISVYDVAREHLQSVCSENGYSPVFDLSVALKTGDFSAAVICTPNNQHISSALMAVDAGLDVFIEKPLSDSMEGVDNLISSIRRSGCIAMAGFNLRFEPGLAYLKKTLNPSSVAFARIEFGSYLPGWRKGVDYRNVYSANKSMGGGIILDDVHEIDYACWLMGYPEKVHCALGKFSNLEIDVEDVADIQLIYPDKLVTIHSDYLQRQYTRRCKVCLRDGDILEWEFGKWVTTITEEKRAVFSYAGTFDPNQMYIEEMKVFIESIKNRTLPESDIENAEKILKIALKAKWDGQ
jgi:predicted dehydrogenase